MGKVIFKVRHVESKVIRFKRDANLLTYYSSKRNEVDLQAKILAEIEWC